MAEVRFRVYIGTIFFALSFILLTTVFTTLYFTLQSKLFDETVDRLKATVTLGALGMDTAKLSTLMDNLTNEALGPEAVAKAESSPEYQTLYQYLNRIRTTNPSLILYVYILAPTTDPNKARFVVDADVLRLREEVRKSGRADDKISGFGLVYDILDQPVTRAVLTEKTPLVETRFIYDEDYKVNSMMGLAPIFDQKTGRFLAALGVDISDRNYSEFLFRVFLLALIIMAILLVAIVVASFLMARRISRPIIELTDAVKRFGDSDFSFRVDLTTAIKEIFDLKENFNAMAQKIETSKQNLVDLNYALERFVPVEFLDFLSRQDITQVGLGDQIQKDMAIMFSDIRSFARISEHLTPKQTFNFLNTYLSRIAPIIRRNNGFVDKYIGDGIMAIFPRRVDDAVRCAVEMAQEIRQLNSEREKTQLPLIVTGTGIHTGTLMMGTIGEAKRMQTTVIGDSVNLASRLEGLTKVLGAQILISREVYNRLDSTEEFLLRLIGTVEVRGKTDKVSVLEVFDQDDASLRQQKAATKKDFEKAVSLLADNKFKDAQTLLERITKDSPADAPAANYLVAAKEKRPLRAHD